MAYRYFTISQGLRGCYLSDTAYVFQVKTRRELKIALEWEAYYIREAGGVGLNKRHIAWLAANAWRGKHSIAPYRWQYQSPGTAPYALECIPETRQEYLDHCKQEGI